MNQQIKRSKIVPLITPTAGAAGTSAINGSVIDFQGYEGALIVIAVGAVVTGAVTSVKFQGGDTSSPTTDIEGTNQVIADTDDDTIKYIDIRRPVNRYGRIVVSRATQNATIGSAVAILYGARSQPTAQPSGVVGEVFVSPAAGTA
jgi:hypothetical protein